MFLTKSIDLLLYISIIISVERRGTRDTLIGMKEMKEIELNYIHKEILRDSLDKAFWEVMDARIYFIDELIYSDYMDYALDMAGDCNDLMKLLEESSNSYVHPHIARKISLHYKAVQELMRDIRFYLIKNYSIDYDKELKEREEKAKTKKEG